MELLSRIRRRLGEEDSIYRILLEAQVIEVVVEVVRLQVELLSTVSYIALLSRSLELVLTLALFRLHQVYRLDLDTFQEFRLLAEEEDGVGEVEGEEEILVEAELELVEVEARQRLDAFHSVELFPSFPLVQCSEFVVEFIKPFSIA